MSYFRARLGPVAVSALLLASAAACGAGTGPDTAASAPVPATGSSASPAPVANVPAGGVTITVTPADGTKAVKPDATVTVAAAGGRLTEVRAQDGEGDDLAGATTPDGTRWNSTVPPRVGTNYVVQAWAVGPDGRQVEKTASFATRRVRSSRTLQIAQVQPRDGAVVGVAQPLAVSFDGPVPNRKLVQKALQVTTTPHVDGAWYWIDDSHVHFRPQGFWPTGTQVRLVAKLSGISAGGKVVGAADRTSTFVVGRNQVFAVDTHAHRMTVTRDGLTVKTFDVSTGKPGWETRDGTEVMQDRATDKHWTNVAIDAKKHFSLHSKYAIRITNSGEFVHDAPWATGTLGDANTSHGCVGLRTSDMKWVWANSLAGDPVVVTGTVRQQQDLWNTYDDWNVPWATWSRGDTG